MKHVQFFYFLITAAIGIVSLSTAAFAYIKTRKTLILYFLYFYVPFTLVIVSAVLLTYIEANIPATHPNLFNILHYGVNLFSFVLLFTLPLFMHYLIDVPRSTLKNILFAGIALSLAVLNYGTEYNIAGEPLPDIKDYIEGIIFVLVLLYVLLLGIFATRTLQYPLKKMMTKKFVVLLGVSLLTVTADILLEGRSPLFFFPIAYCSLSLVFTHHFFTYYLHQIPGAVGSISDESLPRVSAEEMFQQYNISPREQEVLRLVLQGNSNQQIGDTLFISVSTVKKHISNIYLKCDVKSRYELIAMFKDSVWDSTDQTNSGQNTTTG